MHGNISKFDCTSNNRSLSVTPSAVPIFASLHLLHESLQALRFILGYDTNFSYMRSFPIDTFFFTCKSSPTTN